MLRLFSLILFLLGAPLSAQAQLQVFACEPEWGALVRELAGERADIYVATSAQQDPHQVEARPSLIARMRSAQLLVCTGLELEAGWLPLLLQRSGNARVQPGQPGHFAAGSVVPRLEVPARVDRSEGDVHAGGNPHVHLDARLMLPIADALLQRLLQVQPEQADWWRARHAAFVRQWQANLQRWQQQALPLRGKLLLSHHRDMVYLAHWLGMRMGPTLEPRPGIEPGAAHLARLLQQLQREPVWAIVRAPYQSARAADWLGERSQTPRVELPFTVGGAPGADNLTGLFDVTLQRLLEARP